MTFYFDTFFFPFFRTFAHQNRGSTILRLRRIAEDRRQHREKPVKMRPNENGIKNDFIHSILILTRELFLKYIEIFIYNY